NLKVKSVKNIRVLDKLGKIHFSISPQNSNNIIIDCSRLLSGFYFVAIETGTRIIFKKLIIN
ncbi:MAG TPA: hypothetical protein DEH02_18695, partial [Bacteroidales bacterium]|nr:hypothetical protein [Bacteroidales bacterium]